MQYEFEIELDNGQKLTVVGEYVPPVPAKTSGHPDNWSDRDSGDFSLDAVYEGDNKLDLKSLSREETVEIENKILAKF